MTLRMWQVDAFSDHPFGGNPAAIVPLERWLPERTMQSIANENNLAETAFFVPAGDGVFHLRWFTPASEVDLCGHATLASAWVVFHVIHPRLASVSFQTRGGVLTVERADNGHLRMSLPSEPPQAFAAPAGFEDTLGEVMGVERPEALYLSRYLMAVWPRADIIRAIEPGGELVGLLRSIGVWGLVATAPGDGGYDFVSRFFAPDKGVPEDPVTGSAHCALVPYWAGRLGKSQLKARQASPRGGDLFCTDAGERTVLAGPCALYMTAEVETGS